MQGNMKRTRGAILLGIAHGDGHTRITSGDSFVIVGGSREVHEQMQETAIKFQESLSKSGRRIYDLEREEFCDLIRKSSER